LIVYEGDWDRAKVGVQWLASHPEGETGDEDVGEEEQEEMYDDTEEGVEDVGGWEEESEEDSDDGVSDCPCAVRLIDFAHTRRKQGEGPDPGALKGLDTLLNLLDGRIDSLAHDVIP
jgi:1D-myo-inositol-tetrakisphosphate 5-kinase/inositol-polyphosphate multikinase